MRLVTFLAGGGQPLPGALTEDGIVPLWPEFASVLDLVRGGEEAMQRAQDLLARRPPSHSLRSVRLLAPIPQPPRCLFAVGWNYLAHFHESSSQGRAQELPQHPTFFTKPTTVVAGPYDDLPYDPQLSPQWDYEAELAVVIGRGGRSIPEAEAMAHVFGYMAANDITARDLQRRHGGQWLKGKAMDRSCPLGPCLVTADEVPDPHALVLRCWVNGQLRQEASTAQMVFTLPRLIAELSWGMTLLPGDILLTGTPEGVGFARNPPLFLQAGDEVVVSIDGIGELRNRLTPFPLSRYERL
ncbi:MAG: fumarylacetoacetate hydrolase family protein [Dehalococcoidia bacterium]|jgi:2-keto-4-pentenoate hydratase/2-oxohepta-3-ene-1,7-dioic acid hydratase in catechol pathway|nr:fumarylacetoacetate hydrolase family protein [Dehalococcoidia bacterium]MDW8008946.1 fumarylacetoacetate hydrolase family protein [Chloroflexota bacterium]